MNFKILTGRYPVLKSAVGSNLRKLIGVVKTSLDNTITSIGDAYNANFIQLASGGDLDMHGETLGLKRNPGEADSDYKTRLLTEFQDIPTGLTVASLKNAVDQVMGPGTEVDEYYKSIWDWPDLWIPSYSSFGLTSIGFNAGSHSTNVKVGCRFQITSDGAVEYIKAYLGLTGGGTRTAYCAIYSDNAGAPDAKIADADGTQTIDSAAWYQFNFTNVQLTKDDYYWLVINVTGGDWTFYYDAGGTNQAAYNSDTPPPDDPFGTPTYFNRAYSIYTSYMIVDSSYSWEKFFNPIDNRYYVAAIVSSEPTENELDQIEANVTAEKPSHIIVRIVELRPSFYELFREIA